MSRSIHTRSNKESETSAFSAPQDRSQSRPTQGGEDKPSEQETKETQSGLKGPFPREGNQQAQKIKKILELLNL